MRERLIPEEVRQTQSRGVNCHGAAGGEQGEPSGYPPPGTRAGSWKEVPGEGDRRLLKLILSLSGMVSIDVVRRIGCASYGFPQAGRSIA